MTPDALRSTRAAPRVLVVEDEPRLRDLLVEELPDLGFPAAAVGSAEQAAKAMEADPREIVLLDLQLPLAGGMEFFARLRARWPATQVIILTGFGSLEAAREAIRLDVVDFLAKPYHLRDLEVALDRARRRLAAKPQAAEIDVQPPTSETSEATTIAQNERRLILAALERHHGNRTAAAAELGISRRTLHYRLREYRAES